MQLETLFITLVSCMLLNEQSNDLNYNFRNDKRKIGNLLKIKTLNIKNVNVHDCKRTEYCVCCL
jgi:hypothetical protein